MTSDPEVVLSIADLSKDFQGQRALDGAHLELRSGEVHGLLGQNGSGKSTLIKILAGYHRPEPGATIALNGRALELGSPGAARNGGLRFIHQDLGLVLEHDATDNLALGRRYGSRWWLSDRRERRDAARLLAEHDVDIDPSVPLHTLSAAQRSMVAIVRALAGGPSEGGVLVLDEPTAALPAQEVRHLFRLVEHVRSRGTAVLYVTHRLPEVFEICDRVTVLRDGRNVGTCQLPDLDHDGLVELIIGRQLAAFQPDLPPPRDEIVLEAEGIRGELVEDASLRVHQGEIVGVAGLVGSGFETILSLVFGGRAPSAGTVRVDGKAIPTGSPAGAIAAGLAFASADRKRLSAMPEWTLRENLTLPRLPSSGIARWMAPRSERREVRPWLDRLGVVPSEPEMSFGALSGGNQQKVVLARWLRCGARAFLLEEPTNGVDQGAKHAIYEALSDVAAAGAGVLVSSSDAEELCAICDRVIVMADGRVRAECAGPNLTVDGLLAESLKADGAAVNTTGAFE